MANSVSMLSSSTTESQLLLAAGDGDVEFLIEALATQPIDYFLTRSKNKNGEDHYNIIHIAVLNEQTKFLKEALTILPISTLHLLLSQQDLSYFNYNVLHCASLRGNLTIIELLVEFYKSSSISISSSSSSNSLLDSRSKPWLAKDVNGKTPLLVALDRGRVECALKVMELDEELVCNMVDSKGNSALFKAVQRGCEQVAMKILTSGYCYSIGGEYGLTPFHVLPNASEEVCRLLLDKHTEMIKEVDMNGLTPLHKWVMLGKIWPFEFLFKQDKGSGWMKDFINLLWATQNSTGNNPLHTAAYYHNEETVQVVQLLVEAYIDACEQGTELQPSPWKSENLEGNTPLMVSLINKHEKLALYFMSVDIENLVVYATKSVLYCAVLRGCDEAAEYIVSSVDPAYFSFMQLKDDGGQNVLHVASNCTERTCNLLVEKLSWLINEPDDNGKRPLDIASEVGNASLIKLLLMEDPSSSTSAPFAWIKACKKGYLSAIHAFIDHSTDFRTFCLQRKDSPLHHIQLRSYKEYQEFLTIPLIQEMKNMLDFSGSTPLHRALERKDILFAEALLSGDGVLRSIKDKNGKTATDLLVELCNQDYEWDSMCRRTEINPRLRTDYIGTYHTNAIRFRGSTTTAGTTPSAGEMRGTLSVVAALLATLTFAAGFTLPGGLNEDNGEAILGKNASFLVFILADTYAMCCSMLVLFCLIWSMVSDRDKSLLLIDRSVVLLVQSLYGTLVAFMAGVYTAISHKSLWAAIVVIVMCSLVAISANRAILDKVLDKLIPSAKDQRRV